MQVDSTAGIIVSTCSILSIDWVSLYPQEQLLSLLPSFVQVGARVVLHSPKVCSFLAVTVCSTIIISQTEHFLPSVSPVAVQVDSTAGIIISVCFSGSPSVPPQTEHIFGAVHVASAQVCSIIGISFWTIVMYPQIEQCSPSVRPIEVQVASTASSHIKVWLSS